MLALLCAGLTLACSLPGCSRATKLERYNKQFLDVFDTVSMEIGFEKSEADFQKCYESSHAQLLKEHRLYDIYNDYEGINNLKTVNDNAGIQPVKVDPDLLSLIKWGKEVYTLTDGRVNIAYGAVLHLWHDKREAGIEDPAHAELPDQAALEEAAKHTNIEDVIIDDAAGTIYHYLNDDRVGIILGEAGGMGVGTDMTAASMQVGTTGILHGSRIKVLQTPDGQIIEPYSISAGLDYPGAGPLHCNLYETGRAQVLPANDDEALRAAFELTRLEGIIPALESAHALALLPKVSGQFKPDDIVVLTVSGRGDKDLDTYLSHKECCME